MSTFSLPRISGFTALIISLFLSLAHCASPHFINLENGYESSDYGFYSISPVQSCDNLVSRPPPRNKLIKLKELPVSKNYHINDSYCSNTRSRRNTIDTVTEIDMESASLHDMDMPVSSTTSPNSSLSSLVQILRHHCCCCFCIASTCVNCFIFSFYFCGCIIYGLCVQLNYFSTGESVDSSI
jgi:hypothetical protein